MGIVFYVMIDLCPYYLSTATAICSQDTLRKAVGGQSDLGKVKIWLWRSRSDGSQWPHSPFNLFIINNSTRPIKNLTDNRWNHFSTNNPVVVGWHPPSPTHIFFSNLTQSGWVMGWSSTKPDQTQNYQQNFFLKRKYYFSKL